MKPLTHRERDALAAKYRDADPLFRDAQSLVRWAWYGSIVDAGTVGDPSITALMGTDSRETIDEPKRARRGPPPVALARRPQKFSAAAQAGMAKRWIEALPKVQRDHLLAKYLLSATAVHELLAGKEGFPPKAEARTLARIAQERSKARARLARVVLRRSDLPWLRMPLAKALVGQYYGSPTTDKELLEDYDIGRHRLTEARRFIKLTLDAVASQAEEAAYDHFQNGRVLA